MYDDKVFDLIRDITPPARGELVIAAVNNPYIKLGWLQFSFARGRWTDAGTFDSLIEANNLLLGNNNLVLQ